LTLRHQRLALIALALALAFSIASVTFAGDTQPVPEIQPGFLKGYLPREALWSDRFRLCSTNPLHLCSGAPRDDGPGTVAR
jgi:hypothetical protein